MTLDEHFHFDCIDGRNHEPVDPNKYYVWDMRPHYDFIAKIAVCKHCDRDYLVKRFYTKEPTCKPQN